MSLKLTRPNNNNNNNNNAKQAEQKQGKGKEAQQPQQQQQPQPQQQTQDKPKRVPTAAENEKTKIIEEKGEEVTKLIEQTYEVMTQLNELDFTRTKLFDYIKNDRERLKEIADKIASIQKEISTNASSEKNTLDKRKEKENEVSRIKSKLKSLVPQMEFKGPVHNLSEIERRIEYLERRLEESASTLKEEKKIISDINELKASKRLVVELDDAEAGMRKEDPSNVARTNDRKEHKISMLCQTQEKVAQQLRENIAKLAKTRDGVPALVAQRAELFTKIQKTIEERNAIFVSLEELRFSISKAQFEARRTEREKIIAEREKIAAEREKRAKERVEKEQNKTPFEEELAICGQLLEHLKKFLPNANEKPEPPAAPKNPKDDNSAIIGEVMHKPEETKLGKRGGKRQTPKNSVILHPGYVLRNFEIIDAKCPMFHGEVPSAVTLIKQKQAEYEKRAAEAKAAPQPVAEKKEEEVKKE